MSVDRDRLVADIERDWRATGVHGSLVARNLRTGLEVGFGTAVPWPLASVIKLPIALVVHDAFERGDLSPGERFDLEPGRTTAGPSGVSLFRHPSTVAAEDLVQLSLSVSDNAATDVLLERLGVAEVSRRLHRLGFSDIVVRHPIKAIFGTHGAVHELGLGLAPAGDTPGGGHVIPELDPHRANVGTARVLADLLDSIWSDAVSTPAACARLRAALGRQPTRHRLAVELASDSVRVHSKTGTFLHLRHEAGVVETDGEAPIVVVALTRSSISAVEHLEADFAIGHAARQCVEALL